MSDLKATLANAHATEAVERKTFNKSYEKRNKMTELQIMAQKSKFLNRKSTEPMAVQPIVITERKEVPESKPNPSLDSQLGNVFKPSIDYGDLESSLPTKKPISEQVKRALPKAYDKKDLGLCGMDTDDTERYTSTNRIAMNGGSTTTKKKPYGLKKVLPGGKEVINPQVISPITNNKLADYGTWEADAVKEKEKLREAAIEELKLKIEEEKELGNDPLLRKLRINMQRRGAKGLNQLGKTFMMLDKDHSGTLNLVEFKYAMRICKMGISDSDCTILFDEFDMDKNNEISYDEFLHTIAGVMNVRRRKLVNMAYDVLDRDGNGIVDLQDIKQLYNVSKHPEFISGRKSEDELLMEFMSTFEVGGVVDGKVTREEFLNYYSQLSSSIDSDVYFELMIRNAWHIAGGTGTAANSANLRVLVAHSDGRQSVVTVEDDLGLDRSDKKAILERLRKQGVDAVSIPGLHDKKDSAAQKMKATIAKQRALVAQIDSDTKDMLTQLSAALKKRGAYGFGGLQRAFKIMDKDGSKTLGHEEFSEAMSYMNIIMTPKQIDTLFAYFDKDGNDYISYDEFLSGLRPMVNDRRKGLIEQAFAVIDLDGNGYVDAAEIAEKFDATSHPAVKAGVRTAESVLEEFLATFDVGGEIDGKVTQQEFMNYYINLSASIDHEDYFELMIRNAWHISGGEGWAANSSNTRVLGVHADGSTQVYEIKNDLGIKKGDKKALLRQLQKEGAPVVDIALFGSLDDKDEDKKDKPISIPSANRSDKLRQSSNLKDMLAAGPAGGDESIPVEVVERLTEAEKKKINKFVVDFKTKMKSRGSTGYIGLQRKFTTMDNDGSKTLSKAEFTYSLRDMGFRLQPSEVDLIFKAFDADNSGTIDFEEFIQAVRSPLSESRLILINQAFDILDKDGNGTVDAAEVAQSYNASKHPEVLSGAKKSDQVLREFLETFDVGGVVDGKVTREEFQNYYHNLSASIENDEYFELMIRNAWHISGGEGWAANSSNTRVLGVHADGSTQVYEIKNDLGIKKGDKKALLRQLQKEGAPVVDIALFGSLDDKDEKNKKAKPPLTVRKAPAVRGRTERVAVPVKASNLLETASLTLPQEGSLVGSGGALGGLGEGSMTRVPSGSVVFQGESLVSNGDVRAAYPGSNAMQARSTPFTTSQREKEMVKQFISDFKMKMKRRGAHGYIGLQRKFAIMDDDGSKTLSREEFLYSLQDMGFALDNDDIKIIFDTFDSDNNGTIDFEEFIQAVREPLSPRRLALINMAFDILDIDKSGIVDAAEIADKYNTSKHPAVLSGMKTETEVLTEFLSTFDVGGEVDGKVTREEFTNYYANLGASIDNEDYFELMIRNAWHIAGGTGQAANSANRRVLATGLDGRQRVVSVDHDLGIAAGDKDALMKQLRAEGKNVKDIELYGLIDDKTGEIDPVKAKLHSDIANRKKEALKLFNAANYVAAKSVFMDTKRLLLTAFNNNEQAEEVQKNERAMILCDRKAQHANKQAASKFR